jgi:hypothetical protein
MMRRIVAAALGVILLSATGAGTVVTAKILDYERGYIFFTTGDGFRVAPGVQILQYGSDRPAASAPHVRQYARVTFDDSGVVTKIELSDARLPLQGDLSAVHRFAVALSTPAPNPDLANPPRTICQVQAGKLVTVNINVEVPPSTKITDSVYMTTDQSGWNPLAYHLDRVDALHYRTTLRLLSGTILKYLFDRGSASSIQVAESGVEQPPQTLCVGDAPMAVGSRVFRWGDETSSGTLPVPQTMPTPFNPAPFPNLPSQTPPPALSK